MTERNLPCDIFLCHTRADKDWVRELATRLEREPFQARTLNVFFDEWDITPGTNIVKSLENGLSKARFVGVILSPEMLEAEWPTLEWTIAIYEDPSGRKGKVLPILRRDCEIPPSLRVRNILDFRNPEKHERSYAKLLSVLKNEPIPRAYSSSAEAPTPGSPEYFAKPLEFADRITEQIASNLFPVISFPRVIWNAETNARSIGQVYFYLRKFIAAETIPTFILKQNVLYCFESLEEITSPFRRILFDYAMIHSEETKSWLSDPNKRNWLLELLNRAVTHNCENLGLYHDRERNRTYFLPENGGDRLIEWNTGMRKSRRTVVRCYDRGVNGHRFWAHQSVALRFMAINSNLFLRMEPGWTFTQDGVNPLPREKMTSISTKWMYDEYNPSIFYHLRFWTCILAQAKKHMVFDSGHSFIEVDTTPATASMAYGVDGDRLSIDKMYEAAEAETPPVDYLIVAEEEA